MAVSTRAGRWQGVKREPEGSAQERRGEGVYGQVGGACAGDGSVDARGRH